MTIPEDQSMTAPQANTPAKPLQRAVLILLLALIVIIGAVIFMMSRRTGPATDQAKAFIQDMVNGNLDAARARCTSDIDFDAMARLADKKTGKMRFWGKLTDQSLIESSQGDRADVDGTLTFEKTPKNFQATLKKQPDGKFLISAYSFN
jgi:hypothetical protein